MGEKSTLKANGERTGIAEKEKPQVKKDSFHVRFWF